ncbi:MAG: methyltransferase domain-containing protein [Candidatus Hodarchaeota archaeon]
MKAHAIDFYRIKQIIRLFLDNCDNSPADKKAYYGEKFPDEVLPSYLYSQYSSFYQLYLDFRKWGIITKSRISLGLDIGCGYGSLSLAFTNSKIKIIGIDVDYDFSKFAYHYINHLCKKPNIVNATSNFLPFRENSFDFAVSSATFEHDPHPNFTFREVFRVLKPGGKFYILTPNKYDLRALIFKSDKDSSIKFRVKNLFKKLRKDYNFPYVYQLASLGLLKRKLFDAGFDHYEFIKYKRIKSEFIVYFLRRYVGNIEIIAIK